MADGAGSRVFLALPAQQLAYLRLLAALSKPNLMTAVAAEALAGHPNTMRSVLDSVIAYERGEWSEAATLAEGFGLTRAALPEAYTSALKWAQDVSCVTA